MLCYCGDNIHRFFANDVVGYIDCAGKSTNFLLICQILSNEMWLALPNTAVDYQLSIVCQTQFLLSLPSLLAPKPGAESAGSDTCFVVRQLSAFASLLASVQSPLARNCSKFISKLIKITLGHLMWSCHFVRFWIQFCLISAPKGHSIVEVNSFLWGRRRVLGGRRRVLGGRRRLLWGRRRVLGGRRRFGLSSKFKAGRPFPVTPPLTMIGVSELT